MKIGLFFGSFNPIHVGHVIIANHFAEYSDLDEVWMVVTPHNPHKNKSSLLGNYHRYELVYQATKNYPKIKPTNIEFALPQPNYTIDTLAHISEKYPQHHFALLMGEDNLQSLHKWKNFEAILDFYSIYIYPRIVKTNKALQFDKTEKIYRVEAPIIELSSTAIRNGIKEGKNVAPMLPEAVWNYIDEMNFYKG